MSTKVARYVLGYASSHNGGACLLRGEEIVVAVQEERLLRQKRAYHLGSKASLAVQYCLDFAAISPSDLSLIVFSSMRDNTDVLEDICLNPVLRVGHLGISTVSVPHHLAHAIGAYATSGFKSAVALVVDGCGSPVSNLSKDEQGVILPQYQDVYRKVPSHAIHETISTYLASGTTVTPLEKHVSVVSGPRQWPPSLGHMYEAVATKIFGLGLEGAGKVMGLAPYGKPRFPPDLFFDLRDGQFIFREEAIDRACPFSEPWPSHEKEYCDLAASVQSALEVGLLYLVKRASELSGQENLCYSGGVALNSIANERIHREGPFDNIFIMPAAEDSGTAIGAAYYGLWQLTGESSHQRLRCDAVGRRYQKRQVKKAIDHQAGIRAVEHPNVASRAAELICDGAIVGWFQGGSELGPRALGQRSILCDPRRADMKERLNRTVKFRESFRPFAPAILQSEVREWFEVDPRFEESPYMLRVVQIRPEKRELVPAVVHVDGSGRLQTVSDQDDYRFCSLVRSFYERTGCPMVLNTSFNVAGEPIVESPEDAIRCLLLTELDYCVIGDFVIQKDIHHGSVLDFYPRLSSELLWTDVLIRNRSGVPAGPRQSRNHGLLRSFHMDYGDLVDVATMIPGRYALHALATRTVDELGLNPSDDFARAITYSPWGLIVHLLNNRLFELLKVIDGNSSGLELLNRAQEIAPGFFDRVTFLRSIASLTRASIVTLASAPVGRISSLSTETIYEEGSVQRGQRARHVL